MRLASPITYNHAGSSLLWGSREDRASSWLLDLLKASRCSMDDSVQWMIPITVYILFFCLGKKNEIYHHMQLERTS